MLLPDFIELQYSVILHRITSCTLENFYLQCSLMFSLVSYGFHLFFTTLCYSFYLLYTICFLVMQQQLTQLAC